MDICYYNSQIKEELEGAMAYANKAIVCLKDNPSRADQFSDMAKMELGHAAILLSMFKEDYQNESKSDILDQVRETLIEMTAEYSSRVKYILER